MKPGYDGPAIDAVGLVKEFERGRRTSWQRIRRQPDQRERFRAVDGIDLRVERGEIFGVLGPNGAGKTTTMKMLSTLLEPTERHGPGPGLRRRARGARRAAADGRRPVRRPQPLLEAHRAREPRVLRRALPRAAQGAGGADRIGACKRSSWTTGRTTMSSATAPACDSGWCWPARSCPIRSCCCWTSRRWVWTRSRRATCATASAT